MTLKEQIEAEIGKVLVGKEKVIDKVLMAVLADGNILLEDVPGTGKTTLAQAFSMVLDLECKRIQFTPDTMPADITGFSVYRAETGRMEFIPGAVFCNLLLGDEINRTSPRTQAALLEAMSEKRVTVDGITYLLPEPFFCIATQNPTGMAGTQPLPESQTDRFMVSLRMGYPTAAQQIRILKNRDIYSLSSLHPVLAKEDLMDLQKEVHRVWLADEVMEYAIALCEATRRNPAVELGVSPRGFIALMDMSRACAMLRQRDFVIPEDIQEVFLDVCAHRLVLKPKIQAEGTSAADILKRIMRETLPPDRAKPYKRKKTE